VTAAPQLSEVHAAEAILFFVLLQLTVIVLAGRAGGMLAARVGQAAVVGEIVLGILLGPSLFGALAPETFRFVFQSAPALPLNILAQIGLLLLMFQIGLESDFAHFGERRNRRAVLWVAAVGVLAPFVLGLLFAGFIPAAYAGTADAGVFALFFATALSITAMPVLARIMMEFELTRTALGVVAIGAAAMNDVFGWVALAVVTALATAQFDALDLGLRMAGLVTFAALCWWGVRPLLTRWIDRQIEREPRMSGSLMGVVLACIFLAGMATYQLGIFAIFGGFMLGVLLHDRPAFAAAWKERVGHLVGVFFMPVFFTYTGLRTDIGSLADAHAWMWCGAIIGVATLGKFGGCYVAARAAGMDAPRARMLGVMMNTRGLMELVVLNVGYDLGIIGNQMFTMLVSMAIVSTVATSPCLRRWLPGTADARGPRKHPATGPA
jgi:Kef-type K+ transport system membrane component KefB